MFENHLTPNSLKSNSLTSNNLKTMYKSFLFAGMISLVACATSVSPTPPAMAQTGPTAPLPANAVNGPELPGGELENLPPMSLKTVEYLYGKVDQADFLFNLMPITTNASGNDAKTAVAMIAGDSVKTQNCSKPFATIIFTSQGNPIMDGDVFFANGCAYFRLKYEGKTYANAMTDGAFNYFNQVIKHYQDQLKAKQGGQH